MALKMQSKTYESGTKDEGSTLKRAISFLTITVFGIFANVLNLELHFGVNFIFGSIFTMIAIRYYGAALGAIVAFIVSIYTIKLWGHPYAAIIFTVEALFVGYIARKSQKTNYLTIDLAYWLLVGGPLVWLFYGRFLDLPADSILLIFTKQTVNGLTNVAIAALIVTDLKMPDMSGADLIREANVIYGDRLKYVVMTGHVSLSECEQYAISEFSNIAAFLKKPIALEELRGALGFPNEVSDTKYDDRK